MLVLTGSLGCGRKKQFYSKTEFYFMRKSEKKKSAALAWEGGAMILLKKVHQAQEKSDLGMSVVLT